MPNRAIDGWPAHWYDNEGYIPCRARGCTMRFHNGNIKFRGRHWYDNVGGGSPSRSWYDHGILLAIDRQTNCAYCNNYCNHSSLKELLAHEEDEHGSSNMSTIEGYLHLMRQGRDSPGVGRCESQAYQRLMDNIWNSPYRNRLLYRAYPRMLPHEARMRDLDPIISYQNRQAGRPSADTILARDFLTHLRPTQNDHPAWAATYHGLRAKYAEGKI